MRIMFLVLVVALVTTVTSISAQYTENELIDHFQLWHACQPVPLRVEPMKDAAVEMGLTREAIATTVRSRLRAARLYSSEDVTPGQPYLYVSVTTVRRVFDVNIYFFRWLSDPITGVESFATTWIRGMVGHHGGDAGYVLSAVSRKTDEFIDAYLRVNESACSRSPIDP